MNRIFLLLTALLIQIISAAQTIEAKGKISLAVLTDSQKPVENATIELLRSNDSVLVKTAVSDGNGKADLEDIKPGAYLVKGSAVGHHAGFSSVITISAEQLIVTLPALTLKPKKSTELQAVVVNSRKPFIQKLADRIVVNVENSIVSAGSTALDVMERSPGITVDNNDVISLRGRSGVIIMIDGKPSPMTGADLSNYLRNLPSSAIERIDIITNPSAKYEAAGNSGIIDIRLKKDQRMGSNGTFTTGYGQGIYPKANAGASFNYRNKKWNLFGNYNYNYRKNLNHLIINRNFFTNGVLTGSDDKDNNAVMPFNGNTVRLGADFFAGKKTVMGVVVNSNFLHFLRKAEIKTIKNDASGQPLSQFFSEARNNDQNGNTVGNFNLKHRFDSAGKELTVDLDYGRFQTRSITNTSTAFYDLNGYKTSIDDILLGNQRGDLTLKTAKTDFVRPFKKGKWEAGLRSSLVSSDNKADFKDGVKNETDTAKTNRFFYKEYNNAAYANWNREIKKWNVQVGLRAEQTSLTTRQVKGDVRFKKSYVEWFPSAFLNYKLNDDKTVGLSVSRRIDRPGYFQLNPFLFQVDATIYATGAPLLKPQMTWSYEMNYTVKNKNFTLGYSRTQDQQSMVLSRILDVIPNFVIPAGKDSNITVQIPVNLQSSEYVGFTATTPIRINKWWNMVNNLNIYYNHVKANLAGVPVNNGGPAANIRTNNTFTFNHGWSTELNANLNTGGKYGYSNSKPQWGLSVGAQKSVLKSKGTIRFNMTDIFWTNLPKSTITYEGRYVENWHAYRETRVANLSFTYRFGNNKVQAARKRSTGSEDEVRRAGGN